MCGARRRPPYCTKMTRDMGTCSNTPRITWFGQRHLTSTLSPIIAQRIGVPPDEPVEPILQAHQLAHVVGSAQVAQPAQVRTFLCYGTLLP